MISKHRALHFTHFYLTLKNTSKAILLNIIFSMRLQATAKPKPTKNKNKSNGAKHCLISIRVVARYHAITPSKTCLRFLVFASPPRRDPINNTSFSNHQIEPVRRRSTCSSLFIVQSNTCRAVKQKLNLSDKESLMKHRLNDPLTMCCQFVCNRPSLNRLWRQLPGQLERRPLEERVPWSR